MSRIRRIIVPDCAHHVYQRGVRKEPLFHEDRDFLVYIRALKEGCKRYGVSIRTYTLMTNHIHLIAVPKSEDSLSRTLQIAHTGYSKYLNAKYGFTGHAWEGRPGVCVTDESHMWSAVRYVERNPVAPVWLSAPKTISGRVRQHIVVCATIFSSTRISRRQVLLKTGHNGCRSTIAKRNGGS